MSHIVPVGYLMFREAASKIEDALFSGVADRPLVLKLRAAGGDVAEGQANREAISRRARSSSPRIGWAAGFRFLLRTCSVASRPHSTCDHSRSHSSPAPDWR